MNLKHLHDETLLFDTKLYVGRERELTAKILWHLKEIDRRKLFCVKKYSSLFDYCVKELKYSEAAAQRRVQASRILGELPEIEEKLIKGELNLTTLGMAASFFKKKSIKDKNQKRSIIKQLENKTKKEAEVLLVNIGGDAIAEITIQISQQTLESLQELKALIGKDSSMNEVINFAANAAIEKIKKTKFKQINSNSKKEGMSLVKRQVYQRDQKCTNCGSKFNLNFDHRHPKSLGGGFSLQNIRLLCFHCNQRARIEQKLPTQSFLSRQKHSHSP